jgi:lipopolysaccharide assembly protein A
MKFLRKLLTVLLVLAAIGVGAMFALQNKAAVPLDLLVFTFEPRSLALWLLVSLALGGLLGMLASSAILLRLRATLATTRRQLARNRVELDKLRDEKAVTGEGGDAA